MNSATSRGGLGYVVACPVCHLLLFLLSPGLLGHKSFGVIFDSNTWDAIILIKYYSEIFLLILLLSVLQAKPETPSPSNSISSTTASSYGSTFGQKS